MTITISIILALALSFSPAIASGNAAESAHPGRLGLRDDTPAAEVNGQPIRRSTVQQIVKGLARGESKLPDSMRIAELNDRALESLVDLELLYQEALRAKISLGDGEVDSEIAQLRQHFSSENEFEAALSSRGLSRRTLRKDTRRTLLVDRLLQRRVWKGASASDEEIRQFFEENRHRLSGTFDELRNSIARMLVEEKKAQLRAALLHQLRKRARIVRYPPFGSTTSPPTAGSAVPGKE